MFDSVEPGESSSESTPALVVNTAYETELTKRIDFKGRYNFQVVNEASGSFIHHLLLALETEFTKNHDFDISFVTNSMPLIISFPMRRTVWDLRA